MHMLYIYICTLSLSIHIYIYTHCMYIYIYIGILTPSRSPIFPRNETPTSCTTDFSGAVAWSNLSSTTASVKALLAPCPNVPPVECAASPSNKALPSWAHLKMTDGIPWDPMKPPWNQNATRHKVVSTAKTFQDVSLIVWPNWTHPLTFFVFWELFWITLWLLNVAMERSTMLLIGKPSISMGHLYHGYVSQNQMVFQINGGCFGKPNPWTGNIEPQGPISISDHRAVKPSKKMCRTILWFIILCSAISWVSPIFSQTQMSSWWYLMISSISLEYSNFLPILSRLQVDCPSIPIESPFYSEKMAGFYTVVRKYLLIK